MPWNFFQEMQKKFFHTNIEINNTVAENDRFDLVQEILYFYDWTGFEKFVR